MQVVQHKITIFDSNLYESTHSGDMNQNSLEPPQRNGKKSYQ